MNPYNQLTQQEKDLIDSLQLEHHPEGGWFKEVYMCKETDKNDRSVGGSIYFLLSAKEKSHFHVIDCDELWYYHAGCGVKVWFLMENGLVESHLLDLQHPMLIVPKGIIFAAENIQEDAYTLMSCATFPNFTYEGFHLLSKEELLQKYPSEKELVGRLSLL